MTVATTGKSFIAAIITGIPVADLFQIKQPHNEKTPGATYGLPGSPSFLLWV